MATKPADAMRTFTGKWVTPLDLNPDDICIEDIAHHLSQQCRFTGATREFYSVAQHSVYVSMIADWDDRREALLHDASETYLSDINSPCKKQDEFTEYREIEALIMRAVSEKFNLEYPLPRSVHWADQVLLASEFRDLMGYENGWRDMLPWTIYPWDPKKAEKMFLKRWKHINEG